MSMVVTLSCFIAIIHFIALKCLGRQAFIFLDCMKTIGSFEQVLMLGLLLNMWTMRAQRSLHHEVELTLGLLVQCRKVLNV